MNLNIDANNKSETGYYHNFEVRAQHSNNTTPLLWYNYVSDERCFQ